MKQLAKDVLGDLRRSVINLLVVALAPLLWAGAATGAWWGPLLSLPGSQISSIRYWLVFASATALIVVASLLYARAMRRVRRLEEELVEARRLSRRFLDDFEHIPRLGLYRHRTKAGLFCGACTPKEKEAPVQDQLPGGWRCRVCGEWFANPDYREPPMPPMGDDPDLTVRY